MLKWCDIVSVWLIHPIDFRMFGTNALSNPMLTYWDPNCNETTFRYSHFTFSFKKSVFESIVCHRSYGSSWIQCANFQKISFYRTIISIGLPIQTIDIQNSVLIITSKTSGTIMIYHNDTSVIRVVLFDPIYEVAVWLQLHFGYWDARYYVKCDSNGRNTRAWSQARVSI